MRAPFFGKDIVDESQDIFTVAVVILHSDIDDDLIFFTIDADDGRIDGLMFFIQEGDERNEAAFIAVYFLFAFASFIRKGDVQTFIQKSKFAQARL